MLERSRSWRRPLSWLCRSQAAHSSRCWLSAWSRRASRSTWGQGGGHRGAGGREEEVGREGEGGREGGRPGGGRSAGCAGHRPHTALAAGCQPGHAGRHPPPGDRAGVTGGQEGGREGQEAAAQLAVPVTGRTQLSLLAVSLVTQGVTLHLGTGRGSQGGRRVGGREGGPGGGRSAGCAGHKPHTTLAAGCQPGHAGRHAPPGDRAGVTGRRVKCQDKFCSCLITIHLL